VQGQVSNPLLLCNFVCQPEFATAQKLGEPPNGPPLHCPSLSGEHVCNLGQLIMCWQSAHIATNSRRLNFISLQIGSRMYTSKIVM
jgi:hypothetical protein